MRWPIAILVALISPLALAQQPPRAGVPTTTPAAGFRSADVEGQTMRYQCYMEIGRASCRERV